MTLQHLMLLRSAGLKHGAVINAAIDALMIDLAKSGKLGGDFKAKLLLLEQRCLLAHQAMGQILLDTDGRPRSKQQVEQRQRIQDYLAEIRMNGLIQKEVAVQEE